MKGGVHIKGEKRLSSKFIESKFDPKFVYISLSGGHIGKPSKLAVKKSAAVKAGTLLGKADDGISANVFSSVSGKVVDIVDMIALNGKTETFVKIENDFKNLKQELPKLKDESKDSIINRIKEAGIIGLGGAGFPAHVKLTPKEKIDTLILNGCECESYLTCDDVLMQLKAKEVLEGGKLLASVFGLTEFVVAIETNKKSAIKAMKAAALELVGMRAIIKVVPAKYPQGAEKMLIKTVNKRVVALGGLPASVGTIVSNVATAFAVYEAVKLNKPLYERFVTVSGRGIKYPGNYLIKNGTTVEDVTVFAGGVKFERSLINDFERMASAVNMQEEEAFEKYMLAINDRKENDEILSLKKAWKTQRADGRKKIKARMHELNKLGKDIVAKIVVGGGMSGFSVENEMAVLSKTSAGVLFLTPREMILKTQNACINCKRCIKACPMGLKPVDICEAFDNQDLSAIKKLNCSACFECGCCSYVCPARIDLTHKIVLAKKAEKEGK